MRILLFSLILFSALKSQAQNFEKLYNFSPATNNQEYANAGIQLGNGNFLIGINNHLLCLSPVGDSLWSKTFSGYGDIAKLFLNNNSELLMATTKGKMTILKIDSSNGDSLGSIVIPVQPLNYGYTIYDVQVLPDGDLVYCYNLGGSVASTIRRFTPGQSSNKWSNDYAGENWGPRSILLDDTTLVMAGYKGTSGLARLVVRKIGVNNTPIWSKEMPRGTYYVDRKLGVQKNSFGEYLVATSFNMFNILAPTVVKLSASGDSLSASWVANYEGNAVNHGYLTSLAPATGGFYAAGYLNFDLMNPDNQLDGMGYMSMFFVDNAGIITHAKAYNKVGYYQFSPGSPYAGSEGWGNGCFQSANGRYLLYGVGNRIYDPGTGANYQSIWQGYVVQDDSLSAVSGIKKVKDPSKSFTVFPNPFADEFYLSEKALESSLKINLFDLRGNRLMAVENWDPSKPISMTGYEAGIYFLQLEGAGGVEVIKLMKK